MKIGVLVVAYNAATTLQQVLDRIPEDFRSEIDEILVQDDHSADATYLVALGYQQTEDLPLTIVRHPENLGYGGNQKAGYRYAIDHGWDVVVLLHGDGQYAPELIPEMVAPIVEGRADAVFGSRMMERGQARKGGMPAYKYVGNRILSTFQNAVAGMDLTEWHSGYRAYATSALAQIAFERNSDDFDFDTQIILQLHDAGKQIVEIPIPTYYGDEICYVNGLSYARDITRDTLAYRLGKAGFGSGDLGAVDPDAGYSLKDSQASSHARIASWLAGRAPSRVLDLGCSGGFLAEELRANGHHVTGVDVETIAGVTERVDHFVVADLEAGIPDSVGTDFDVIIAADVIEHVRDPESLLAEMTKRLAPGGVIVASVPNFGHWYPRARVALGVFDYDQRGILDKTHLRFFTRRSLHGLVRRAGLTIRREEATGLPIEAVADDVAPSVVGRVTRLADQLAVNVRPTLFAYQFVLELAPADD